MTGKVENILCNFLDRNKEYAIHAYVRNGVTDSIIARLLITIDRTINAEGKKCLLEWNCE